MTQLDVFVEANEASTVSKVAAKDMPHGLTKVKYLLIIVDAENWRNVVSVAIVERQLQRRQRPNILFGADLDFR